MDMLIKQIKELMINVSTGKSGIDETNEEYQKVYNELNSEYERNNKINPNPFSDLWEFYSYWKEHLPQYADRRTYIIKMYKEGVSTQPQLFDHWSLIHDSIIKISKSRFESGHFADSVEAAMKEVNVRVKNIYKAKTGIEEDGSSLMKKAFSVNNPIIKLDEIGTENGRNIQLGYMELFSGSMIGIRNPKAHANITITKERAIHFIFLASLLMYKIDESNQ